MGRYWYKGGLGGWRVFLMLQLNIFGMCLLDIAFKTNFHGILLGLARCLNSSSLKWGFGGLESSGPGFLFCIALVTLPCKVPLSAVRGYQDAKRSSCFLSRGLQLPDSDVTFQSLWSLSTCFSCFFTFLFTSTQR